MLQVAVLTVLFPPVDTIAWWVSFLHWKLDRLSDQTRALIRVMDARGAGGHHFNLYGGLEEKSFERGLLLSPAVDCLLLDNLTSIDMRFLRRIGQRPSANPLLMLSFKNCSTGVPLVLSTAGCVHQLVYLDLSGPSRNSQQWLGYHYLPDLRILKLRGKQMDTAAFSRLALTIKRRLWSLDVSYNNLTDDDLLSLAGHCFPSTVLRTGDRAQVEGILITTPLLTGGYGSFFILQESSQSENFSASERYFVDPPAYSANNVLDDGRPRHLTRSDGSAPLRSDTADDILSLLSRDGATEATNHLPGSTGITHLHLSGNRLSALALERFLRASNGQLEHLDCGEPLLYPPPTYTNLVHLSKTVALYGFSGMSHVFRPVWSSNLRSLRIHHSLVTNMPTLKIQGESNLDCIYWTEKQLLPGLDLAYPLAFLPDMNPRLESLTLTCIPRHSFGPVTHRLVVFLRLLGEQERSLAGMNAEVASRQGRPLRLLHGLRHLILEMEPSADVLSSPLELDAEELMTNGDMFSFFDSPAQQPWAPAPPPMPRVVDVWGDIATRTPPILPMLAHPTAAYNPAQLANARRDYSQDLWVKYDEGGRLAREIIVWAGNPQSQNPVVRTYNTLVLEHGLQERAGPVTLPQTKAGAPEECIIFHTAWFFASLPQQLQLIPINSIQPPPMTQDVAAVIRQHRLSSFDDYKQAQEGLPCEPYWHWTGTLEIRDAPPPSL